MSAAAVADALLADLAPLDPDAATAAGHEPDVVVPLLAPEAFAARHEALLRARRALPPGDGDGDGDGDAGDRVLAAALAERLDSDLALDDAGFTTALLAPLATPAHLVRGVFDSLPRATPDEWARLARNLAEVPQAMRDWSATLRSAPRVAAARQVTVMAAQCRSWVDPAGADYYRRLVAGCPEPLRAGLETAARRASEATADFAEDLERTLLPRAPRADPVGRELYSVTAQAFLGDTVDLDETYAFGWDELARLTAEMTALARELGHDSIEGAAAALDADPARTLATGDVARWLQQRVDETVDALDGVHVDLPPQARVPEAGVSSTAAGVMYYVPPDAALTRPGRIWWSAPASGTTSTWREVSTVHHEGVPGHHLQIVTALAEPGLHPWQRSLCHVHGYAEGWAHYAERLADELGLLRDPGERLGMLFGQRWRAARIVIDLGLHLQLPIPAGNGLVDATTWTPGVGAAALRVAAGADDVTAGFEIDRYLGWPGQALAFRVGARLWREIRAEAQRRPGFDLRDFHMTALRLGPMGLGPLRDLMTGDDRAR